MYKITQNYLQDGEYEYAHDYSTIAEAQADINEYENEDIKQGKCYSYDIIDIDGNNALENERTIFEEQAIEAMESIGLTKDEAERELADIRTF
jgi:hypothetical protein